MQIDEIDVKILPAFGQDANYYPGRVEVRKSVSRIAAALNINESTVRARIGKYMSSGFVTGWNFFLNPNATGNSVAQIRLDVYPPSAMDDVLQKLRLIEGIWVLVRYHGNVVGVGLFYTTLESLQKKVTLMAGIANSTQIDYGTYGFPPCNYSFAKSDVDIIRVLQKDPTKEYNRIATETRLSSKTVRRRIEKMMSERAFFVAPVQDWRKLTGVTVADMFVFYQNQEVAGRAELEVISIVEKSALYRAVHNPLHSYFILALNRFYEINDILVRVNRIEGVRTAYLDPGPSYIGMYEIFNEFVNKLVDKLGNRMH